MRRFGRRAFLKGTLAAAAAPYVLSASAPGAAGRPAPSNRIGIGVIGTGGQGGWHVKGLLEEADVQVLATCDVDAGRRENHKRAVEARYAAEKASGAYKGCDSYGDFRDVLARKDIDAVLIAVPDHWHGLISVMAARAGKDIYCEKPMAATIAEGRAAADAAKRFGRIFQTGSQERSGRARLGCELVRNGRIGRLHTIRTYLPVDSYTQGPAPAMPVPPGFDYDTWLGPAPWEPYTEKRCHFNFRWILDYSDGELTDRGCHINDIALWGAGPLVEGPVEVEGKGRFRDDTLWNVPIEFHIEYTCASGLRIITESSGQRGIRFEGTDGWIFVAIHGGDLSAEPATVLRSAIGPNEVHLPHSNNHRRNWLDAIKTRGETVAPAEAGHRTASFCHVGLIAMLLGRKVKWDLKREQFIGDAEANRMIARPMRSPWHL